MPDDNGSASESEPVLTRSVIAGIIGGFLLLVIARTNRSIDFLNGDELDQAKALITLSAPIVAALLIRRHTVSVTKHEQVVEAVRQEAGNFGTAVGYAQAIEDHRPARPKAE
jgi:hypothetical protein